MSKSEEGGFRITLPSNREQTDRVGLEMASPIKGNFEITAGYEILRADKAITGYGVGLELFIETESPTREGLGVYRVVRVKEGDVYMVSRNTTKAGNRQYLQKFFPTATRSGRLRLTRTGTEATVSAADGREGNFRELSRYALGTEDVKTLWLSAYTGHSRHGVDLRIVDLMIHSDSPITVQNEEATTPQDPSLNAPKGGLAGAVLLVLLLVFALVVCLFVRRSGRAAKKPTGIAAAEKEATSRSAQAISFSCPVCGKKLETRAELAGKKVKCPQCAQPVHVPGARTGESDRTPL
jgi:hypothetical protein